MGFYSLFELQRASAYKCNTGTKGGREHGPQQFRLPLRTWLCLIIFFQCPNNFNNDANGNTVHATISYLLQLEQARQASKQASEQLHFYNVKRLPFLVKAP